MSEDLRQDFTPPCHRSLEWKSPLASSSAAQSEPPQLSHRPPNLPLFRSGGIHSTILLRPAGQPLTLPAIGQGASFPRRSIAPTLLEDTRRRSPHRVTAPPSEPFPSKASPIRLVVAEPPHPRSIRSHRERNFSNPSNSAWEASISRAHCRSSYPSPIISRVILSARVPWGGSHQFMGAGLWGCDGGRGGEMRTPAEAGRHPSAPPLIPREERTQFLKDWSRARRVCEGPSPPRGHRGRKGYRLAKSRSSLGIGK